MRGGGALLDRTNHLAITLTTDTKRGLLIAATTCTTVPIPKCNLQLCVRVCVTLPQSFSCMAIVQPFLPQSLQHDHSPLISPLREDMASCSPFPVLLLLLFFPFPPLKPYCLSGSHGWSTNAEGRGGRATIRGTRMVFIFLTADPVRASSCAESTD